MAKEDFCFTFYDGDAARDMAHMNRLERGGYMDILLAQRKFGKLSEDRIKKILGKDYAEIWSGIEVVLKKDDTGIYVAWLWDSEMKAKKHSEKQKKNAEERWSGEKSQKKSQTNANIIPNQSQTNADCMPLEDGYEDVNENGNRESKGGSGEKREIRQPLSDSFVIDVDLLAEKVFLDKEHFCRIYLGWGLTEDAVWRWLQSFNRFLRFKGHTHKPESDYRYHFGNWLKMRDLASNPDDYQPVVRVGQGVNNAKTQEIGVELKSCYVEHCSGKQIFGKLTPAHYELLRSTKKVNGFDEFKNKATLMRIRSLEGSNDGPTVRLCNDYKEGKNSESVKADVENIEKISKRFAVWNYFEECRKKEQKEIL